MSTLWYLLTFLILINSSIADQLCMNACLFEYRVNTAFDLPSNCTRSRQSQCSVALIFDYQTGIVIVEFGSVARRRSLEPTIQTDTIAVTMMNLEEPIFFHNTIEYYCSTGDDCDLNYIRNIALPSYGSRSCEQFRSTLIHYLHPSPSSDHRECMEDENSIKSCNSSCNLIYAGPGQTKQGCDGQVDLTFETVVGFSAPFNKPEYHYRSLTYGCTSQLCNGIVAQHRIERLIDADDGKCMIFLNRTESTTTLSPSSTTGNHAETFSKSFSFMIFIVFFSMTFF